MTARSIIDRYWAAKHQTDTSTERAVRELISPTRDLLNREETVAGVLGRGHDAHLTVTAAAVAVERTSIAIMHHPRLRRWVAPGGHADGDGDLVAVAARELMEETGLAGDVVHTPIDIALLPAGCIPDCIHIDVRFVILTRTSAQAELVSPEGHEVRWASLPSLVGSWPADDPLGRLARATIGFLTRKRLGP